MELHPVQPPVLHKAIGKAPSLATSKMKSSWGHLSWGAAYLMDGDSHSEGLVPIPDDFRKKEGSVHTRHINWLAKLIHFLGVHIRRVKKKAELAYSANCQEEK